MSDETKGMFIPNSLRPKGESNDNQSNGMFTSDTYEIRSGNQSGNMFRTNKIMLENYSQENKKNKK